MPVSFAAPVWMADDRLALNVRIAVAARITSHQSAAACIEHPAVIEKILRHIRHKREVASRRWPQTPRAPPDTTFPSQLE